MLHHSPIRRRLARVAFLLKSGGFIHIGSTARWRGPISGRPAASLPNELSQSAAISGAVARSCYGSRTATPLKNVAEYSDFFTTSECRDLLFHVQEHQFTIHRSRHFWRKRP